MGFASCSGVFGCTLLAFAAAPAAFAAPVYWGNNPNNSFDAGDITFSKGNSDKGFFGDPEFSTTPNTINFFPDNFIAQSDNGPRVSFTDALRFTVTSDTGADIQSIRIRETGDYFVAGAGSVQAFGYLEITKLAGSAGGYKGKDFLNVTYSDTDGNPLLTSESVALTLPLGGAGDFDGLFEIMLPAGVTAVKVVLNNILTADSGPDGTAIIQKKFLGDPADGDGPQFEIDVVIPEPASLAWLGIAALAIRRTRRA